jgi:SynChlorMet cassette protein ScmC
MTNNLTMSSSLELADGSSWVIYSKDKVSTRIAEILTNTMQLKSSNLNGHRLIVVKNNCSTSTKSLFFSLIPGLYSNIDNKHPVVCQISNPSNNDELAIQLMKLSLIFCSLIEAQGGMLIHGALAEKNGEGIILAGPGDVGKTTASKRFLPPWKSLSDDCTLVVRDNEGSYRAHPWPTWSTFMFGGKGGSWNVQYSVPLKAIFVLKQSQTDEVASIGQGQAVCLLSETADQAWWGITDDIEEEKKQAMSLQRFNNICEITKKIPTHLLNISKNGSFWKEIERVI